MAWLNPVVKGKLGCQLITIEPTASKTTWTNLIDRNGEQYEYSSKSISKEEKHYV